MTESLRDFIDLEKLPSHIAIIMDGNGRWAKKKFLPRTSGHKEGMKRVIEIVEVCGNIGIKYLSLYAFSTENWKRPKEEINNLMKLLAYYIDIELDTINKNNVKIQVMGDVSKLPSFVKNKVNYAMDKTKNNNKMILNIGLNYGGRDEIIRAAKLISKDIANNKIKPEYISEETFNNYLDTYNIPDVDLLIRPSGEYRLSNFMLYQIAYAEFWFSNIYWPDFKEENLYKALIDYQKRNRRFGGI